MKLIPVYKGQGETRGRLLRLVGGSFNKQVNLHTRFVLGGQKMSQSLHSPPRIVNKSLHRGLNWVQSCIPTRDPQQHITLPRLLPWKRFPLWEQWAEGTFQGQGRGWCASNCPGLTSGSTVGHIHSVTFPNIDPHLYGQLVLKIFFFFFDVDHFFKSSLNLLQYFFCFMFWFFGHEACGILAPEPGIEPAPPALEGKVPTTGPPGKSLANWF